MFTHWFVKEDLDGFFGLALDNFIQFVLIVTLGKAVCGFPDELLFGRILPGAAVSLLWGNAFYAWQARRIARKTGRSDVTALPYGINTVSLFAYIFFIIGPVYQQTHDVELAWRVGLLACFVSGVIEFVGSFIAEQVRQWTPRAALLSCLAGIAVSFISMDFVFRTFDKPLLALLPLAILLANYFSHIRLPFGISGGLAAVFVGMALAAIFGVLPPLTAHDFQQVRLFLPKWFGGDLWQVMNSQYIAGYLSITLPMGIFNVVGSLQNIESARAAGDTFPTRSSLVVNGVGSVLAALLGSCFPTTIYIGHPGWKKMGARWGYSLLNGLVMTFLTLTGLIALLVKWVPLEAGMGILLWIGIIITAQAFQETPKEHAPAVALGLFPCLAAWGLLQLETGLRTGGMTLFNLGASAFERIPALNGILALEKGFIFTSMILAAMAVHLIERSFGKAALWAGIAAVLSFLGIIHSYEITPGGTVSCLGLGMAPEFSGGYLAMAVLFGLIGFWNKTARKATKTKNKITENNPVETGIFPSV